MPLLPPFIWMNTASTEPSTRDQKTILLEHMGALYRFAQAMMPNPTEAAHLVEATYKHAFTLLDQEPVITDEKAWLFRLMRTVRATHQGHPTALPDETTQSFTESPPLGAVRRQLVQAYIDRTLPASLAHLPEHLRLVLLLCDAEGFTLNEASRVLHIETIDAHEYLHDARARMQTDVWRNAPPLDRALLNSSLPDNWLQEALQRTLEHHLVPVPPTLESTVVDASRHEASSFGHDRTAHKHERPQRRYRSHALVGLLIITVAGLLGYFGSQAFQYTPDVNVITLSVDEAESFEPIFRTPSIEQAERWIQDRLDWRLTLPEIQQATLVGVGVSEIAAGVDVPAFSFTDRTTNESITLYAYSYGLLSRYADRLQLERDVLLQIEEDSRFYIYDLNATNQVLVWRFRDEIFVAVVKGNAEALRPRITFPS